MDKWATALLVAIGGVAIPGGFAWLIRRVRSRLKLTVDLDLVSAGGRQVLVIIARHLRGNPIQVDAIRWVCSSDNLIEPKYVLPSSTGKFLTRDSDPMPMTLRAGHSARWHVLDPSTRSNLGETAAKELRENTWAVELHLANNTQVRATRLLEFPFRLR